ncbi:MAG: RNA polymerase sigma factor [Planctomycetes bacterium]|nr:RNA polymerase sigma factor [Planctomycetota bacterium]
MTSKRISDADARQRFIECAAEHRHALYGFARQCLRDAASAEDVVQETYVSAMRGFSPADPPRDLRAWLFTILVRRVLTHNRDLAREAGRIELRSDLDDVTRRSAARFDGNVERALEDTSDPLKRAISRLAPVQRAVFWLRAIDEFDYREIADWLGIPVGTATSHATRAREQLRRELGSWRFASGNGIEKG